jgi:hypothetical protein
MNPSNPATPEKPRRFVVLQHIDRDGTHFDLMIENGPALATWKCPQPLSASGPLECRRIADHRAIYLDYEGPISGDRGTVTRWDRGLCQVSHADEDRWQVNFAGEKLRGDFLLLRTDAANQLWSFRRLGT